MPDPNLFLSLIGVQSEIATSNMLTFLLEKFSFCRSEFLSLLNCSANPENFNIIKEHVIYQGNEHIGNVDIVLKNTSEQYVFFIENKPWETSSFTSHFSEGDQLKRYANALKKEEYNTYKKILCLLATESNKKYLLHTAAAVEGESISGDEISLKNYYADNYGIDFITITWEQLFERFVAPKPENAVIEFLVMELKEYLFPPKPELPPDVIESLQKYKDEFSYFKQLATDANTLLLKQNSNLNQAGKNSWGPGWYALHIESPDIGLFHFGPSLADCIRLAEQKPEQKLEHPFAIFFYGGGKFFIKKEEKFFTKPFADEILLSKCDFVYYEWNMPIYTKLLVIDDPTNITPQKIADAVMKVVNQVSEEYKKIVHTARDDVASN